MKYALFLGCNIPARVVQYETAARAVMQKLGVQLVDSRNFKCCGYPVRNLDQKAYLLSASENLATAEKLGLNIISLCKCCFGSLKEAENFLKEEGDVQEEIKHALAQKGLQYEGKFEVKHFLSVLYHDVGLDEIKSHISQSYKGLKIATHYGCHALRPSKVTQFDDPIAPSLFDKLVEATGAQSIDYNSKLDCCGAPVMGVNDDLFKFWQQKILPAKGQMHAAERRKKPDIFRHFFDSLPHKIFGHTKEGNPLPESPFFFRRKLYIKRILLAQHLPKRSL